MKKILLLCFCLMSGVLNSLPPLSTDLLEAYLFTRKLPPQRWRTLQTVGEVGTGIGSAAVLAGLLSSLQKTDQSKVFPTWGKWALGAGMPLSVLSGLLAHIGYRGQRYHRLDNHIRSGKPITDAVAKEIHHFFTHGYLYPQPAWGNYVIAHRDHQLFNRVERSLKLFKATGKRSDKIVLTVNDIEPKALTAEHYTALITQYAQNEHIIGKSKVLRHMKEAWPVARQKHQQMTHNSVAPLDVAINGIDYHLHPQFVHNYDDQFCAAHSMASSLTGQRYHGPEFALWLAHYSPDCPHHITRALRENDRMPLGLYHMIPHVLGCPLFLWPSLIYTNKGLRIKENAPYVILGADESGFSYGMPAAIHLMTDFNHVEYFEVTQQDRVLLNKKLLEDRLKMWDEGVVHNMGPRFYHAASVDMYMIFQLYLYARAANDFSEIDNDHCYDKHETNDESHQLLIAILTHIEAHMNTMRDARGLLLCYESFLKAPSGESWEGSHSQWLNLAKMSRNKKVQELAQKCVQKWQELEEEARSVLHNSLLTPISFAE